MIIIKYNLYFLHSIFIEPCTKLFADLLNAIRPMDSGEFCGLQSTNEWWRASLQVMADAGCCHSLQMYESTHLQKLQSVLYLVSLFFNYRWRLICEFLFSHLPFLLWYLQPYLTLRNTQSQQLECYLIICHLTSGILVFNFWHHCIN